MSVEHRPDGAVIIRDGHQGIMLTRGIEKVILVTGSGTAHPFDAVPAALGYEAVLQLVDELRRLTSA